MKRFLLLWLAGASLIAIGLGSLNVPRLYPLMRRGVKTCGTVTAFEPNNHRSEEHTSELQSQSNLVCRLLLEKTNIILIKLIRVSLGTVRHPRRFKIVVIDIQITLKQMLRDFIVIRVNRAKKSGMVNITSSVNSRERSGINSFL